MFLHACSIMIVCNMFSYKNSCDIFLCNVMSYVISWHHLLQVWCTQERSKHVIGFVCLSAFLVTLPTFFEFTAIESLQNNMTKITVQQTSFGSTGAYRFAYTYTMQTLFSFGPFCLLAAFNSLLVGFVCSIIWLNIVCNSVLLCTIPCITINNTN